MKNLVARRVHPNATAYVDRLYELRGFEPHLAQQIEEKFFKSVDSLASDVLDEAYQSGTVKWNAEKRSAWTRFIFSLLVRCPEDLVELRQLWFSDFISTNDQQEQLYAELRQEGDPRTFSDFLESTDLAERERYFFEIFLRIIDSQRAGDYFNSMHWQFIDLDVPSDTLFTSDRPIIRTNGLTGSRSHLVLPVGQRKLFVAANSENFIEAIGRRSHRQLMLECNRRVVGSAVKFVYSKSEDRREFVLKHFGTTPQRRIVQTINENRSRLASLPKSSR